MPAHSIKDALTAHLIAKTTMNDPQITTLQRIDASPVRTHFVRTFVIVFLSFAGILFSIDFVPEPRVSAELRATTTTQTASVAQSTPVVPQQITREVTTPTRIRIRTIGVDASIVTPKSTNIDVLDRALLSGAVHYPGTALSGETGNMLIFGHSSYLPVVVNKAFQTFNELGKLKSGDTIEVSSATHRYTYSVDSVTLSRAEDALVPLNVSRPTLTLATCNTFGAKQERWVVVAHLTQKSPI
jgi:LPXTG-site transpeptidase (sortase) family protein